MKMNYKTKRYEPRLIAPTVGRVLSKHFIATLKPPPGSPTTFSAGTTTSSNVTPRVSDALKSI